MNIERSISPFKQRMIELTLKKKKFYKKKKITDVELYAYQIAKRNKRLTEDNKALMLRILRHEDDLKRFHTNAFHTLNMIRAKVIKANPVDILQLFIQKIILEKKDGFEVYQNLMTKIVSK